MLLELLSIEGGLSNQPPAVMEWIHPFGSRSPSMWLINSSFDQFDMGEINSSNHVGKALIIEDDKEMRSLLEDFLKEEGFETESAEKGTYALKKLLTESFVIIITDVRMPGFSGLDILPELRRLQPKTPIIVITAFGSEEVHHKAILRGADAYLEKPVHLLKLRTLIQNLVNLTDK